jgi:hypothetical protein
MMGNNKVFYLPTRVITGLGCSRQLGASDLRAILLAAW